MATPRHPKFDARAQERFLNHFLEHGLLYLAAMAAGVSATTVTKLCKADKAFEEKYNAALEVYRDKLEEEAHRRAVKGVDEEHYFKGEHTHTVTRYSDRLMELLLKRHRHEYRENVTVNANVTGGVFVMPAEAMTSQQWEEQPSDSSTTGKGAGKRPPTPR